MNLSFSHLGGHNLEGLPVQLAKNGHTGGSEKDVNSPHTR